MIVEVDGDKRLLLFRLLIFGRNRNFSTRISDDLRYADCRAHPPNAGSHFSRMFWKFWRRYPDFNQVRIAGKHFRNRLICIQHSASMLIGETGLFWTDLENRICAADQTGLFWIDLEFWLDLDHSTLAESGQANYGNLNYQK